MSAGLRRWPRTPAAKLHVKIGCSLSVQDAIALQTTHLSASRCNEGPRPDNRTAFASGAQIRSTKTEQSVLSVSAACRCQGRCRKHFGSHPRHGVRDGRVDARRSSETANFLHTRCSCPGARGSGCRTRSNRAPLRSSVQSKRRVPIRSAPGRGPKLEHALHCLNRERIREPHAASPRSCCLEVRQNLLDTIHARAQPSEASLMSTVGGTHSRRHVLRRARNAGLRISWTARECSEVLPLNPGKLRSAPKTVCRRLVRRRPMT